MSDELAQALADDLAVAFERLVETYQHRLYAFVLRLVGDPREAEEVAQDAFVRGYRALTTYPAARIETLAVRPWLYQIALNLARNRLRGRRPLLVSLSPLPDQEPLDPPADAATDPAARLVRQEERDQLARCLIALPLRYRAAVILRHIDGLPYDEIARTLNVPIGTAKANVHRGSRLLRDALTTAGIGAVPASERPPDRTAKLMKNSHARIPEGSTL